MECELQHGYKVGDEVHTTVQLREATSGDVIDAQVESERLVFVPGEDGSSEPALVVSPSLVAIHVLRRQIVRIGDIDGPLDLAQTKRLDPEDLNLLLERTGQLDNAAVAQAAQKEAARRGRVDESGSGR